MKIKVAIVEDDKNYNQALRKVLDYHPEFVCVGQFYSGNDAINELPEIAVDVAIVDIHLQDYMGYEVVQKLKTQLPDTQFVMCTNFEDDKNILKSIQSGAVGYLLKGESLENIIASIIAAHKGGSPMSDNISRKVLNLFQQKLPNSTDSLQMLTQAELDILGFLAQGYLYKEIADKKFVSIETVKKHINHIYKKLNVGNKVEAVNLYNQNKI